MALFRGIQEYIALDANNITLVLDSGNIVNISGNIFLYPPQGHPILYKYHFCFILITESQNEVIEDDHGTDTRIDIITRRVSFQFIHNYTTSDTHNLYHFSVSKGVYTFIMITVIENVLF